MKVPKVKVPVRIVFQNGSVLLGFLHVYEGCRPLDFINENKKNFVAITEAVFEKIPEATLPKKEFKANPKKNFVLVNKNAINWLEEVEQDEE